MIQIMFFIAILYLLHAKCYEYWFSQNECSHSGERNEMFFCYTV